VREGALFRWAFGVFQSKRPRAGRV
jgi:hypothetical protein